MKNVNKKHKNKHFEKQKNAFLSHVSRIIQLKNQRSSRLKGVLTLTGGWTDTKVKAEDTLSGFQEFFLQPIIKDRSNIRMQL